MHLRRLLSAAALTLLILCAAGWTGYSQGKKDNREIWEYKAVGFSNPEDGGLNELGKQGWELVGVSEVKGMNFYFLKRRQ